MDEQQFDVLYRQHAKPLRAYLLRSLGNAAAADDLLQESFARLLAAAARTTSPEHARNYLFRIASNLVVDSFRKRRFEQPLHDQPAPVHAAPIDLERALRQLAPRERQLLWLYHVAGWTHRELARALDLTEGSSRVLLCRARHKLAQLLGRTP